MAPRDFNSNGFFFKLNMWDWSNVKLFSFLFLFFVFGPQSCSTDLNAIIALGAKTGSILGFPIKLSNA